MLLALVFRGVAFELAAILFNVIWWHACHDRRLLTTTIDSAGVRAIGRRFRLAVAWIATGTLLGAVLPALGVAVIAALIPCYWLPIAGELEVGLDAVAAPIRGHDGTGCRGGQRVRAVVPPRRGPLSRGRYGGTGRRGRDQRADRLPRLMTVRTVEGFDPVAFRARGQARRVWNLPSRCKVLGVGGVCAGLSAHQQVDGRFTCCRGVWSVVRRFCRAGGRGRGVARPGG